MSHKLTKYRVRGRLVGNPSLHCMNCGKRNHKYNNCMDPLNSYGILCFYKHEKHNCILKNDTEPPKEQKRILLWSEMAAHKTLITSDSKNNIQPYIPKSLLHKQHQQLQNQSTRNITNNNTKDNYEITDFYDEDEEPRQLAIRTMKGVDIDLDKYRDLDQYKLLMVRRKHTIPYVEFLRGKYKNNDLMYLCLLFSRMTYNEIEFISNNPSFQVLRKELGLNSSKRKSYRMEYENSEVKFSYIRDTGVLLNIITIINKIYKTHFKLNLPPGLYPDIPNYDDTTFCNIFEEIRRQNGPTITRLYNNPEWGIPKGKRQLQETDLQCAIREFCEETGIQPSDLKIFKNCIPLEEIYIGINGIKYRHVYFIGEIIRLPTNTQLYDCNESPEDSELIIPLDAFNREQVGEISAVKLMGFHKAVGMIRRFHGSKKTVVQKAFYNICTYQNYFNVA